MILYSAAGYGLILTNYPLASLFPKYAGFIMVFGQVVTGCSPSIFQLWAHMFEIGISFRWIIAMNLFLALIVLARTFLIMPIGWFQKDMNVYHESPDAVFYRTDSLLYHKFGNVAIFGSLNLYSLCSSGYQDYQKIIYF